MFKPYAFAAAALVAAFAPAAAYAQATPTASATQQQKQAAQTAAPSPQQTLQAPPTPAPSPAPAAAQHEYAPITEKTFTYKDWTFKSLKDGAPVNLREWSRGKKLVMVVYYAPWCGNWKMQAPVVARLYDKYKRQGLDVIAVSEYAPVEQSQKFFGEAGAPYAVVVESDSREARDQTSHYALRQACDDKRKWGSPFNVFIEPAKLNPKGEVLAEKLFVSGGELIEEDAEQFIRQRLGLGPLVSALIEPCEIKK